MSYQNSLSLSDIIPVSVVISPAVPAGPTFNQGLIVGSSTVIPTATRLEQFTSITQIATAGFATTSPEYIAGSKYFSQVPAPTYLWIGRQDLTAIQTIGIASAGTGYAVGDTVAVNGITGSIIQITAATAGVPSAIAIVNAGTGATIETGVATTAINTSGSGLTLTITAIGETPVQAITACRSASPVWYGVEFVGPSSSSAAESLGSASSASTALTVASVVGTLAVGQLVVGTNIAAGTFLASGSGTSWVLSQPTTGVLSSTSLVFYAAVNDAAIEAVAAFVEAASPPSLYFFSTSEATILNSPSSNLFTVLQGLGYNRTFGLYSTTSHAVAAVMGYVMGANTGAAGSYFTLMFKPLIGVSPEPLTQSQVNLITGPPNAPTTGMNGNLYVDYANGSYNIAQNGVVFSGRFLDITVFLDVLASKIQINAMNLFVSQPSVPLTQQGVTMMVNVISQACNALQQIGFIAPSGVWNGVQIGTIAPGTPMPKGYIVYSPPITSLSAGQRSARQLPAMNVLIQLAGAGQSIAISVNVQQ